MVKILKSGWYGFIAILFAITGCKTAAKQGYGAANPLSIKYYYGQVAVTSPDGKTRYGPLSFSLVKRTINPLAKTINEFVKQGDKIFNTTLTQTSNPAIFDAADDQKTFTGTITFKGKTWNWDTWEYNITLADKGGQIVGSGELKNAVISTRKKLIGNDGLPNALISETLNEISEDEYKSKMN